MRHNNPQNIDKNSPAASLHPRQSNLPFSPYIHNNLKNPQISSLLYVHYKIFNKKNFDPSDEKTALNIHVPKPNKALKLYFPQKSHLTGYNSP